ATTPFPDWWHQPTLFGERIAGSILERAQTIANKFQDAGANYISIGPALLQHDIDWLDVIPALLSATDSLFATAEIANKNGQIDIERCHRVSNIIRRISTITPDGFGNLYFTALANCAAGSPFFPVAYHSGGSPRFAIAVESADVAVKAIQKANNLDEARHNLVTAIEETAAKIAETAVSLSRTHQIPFDGIDFSLAPYPTDDKSLGGALEAVGVPHIGAAGSLFAAAFVTEAIDRAQFHRCGFSGLMLPVLEDSVLARRAAEGVLSVQDLLSYAAVCGTGLDTIPLPGDVSEAQLTAVLLDIAALATRLNKPLTARLMPLPGLEAGDPVRFDFPYFANSRVMPISGDGTTGLLNKPATIKMTKVVR
ncbi:MAG: DUF711 family protein, partial [Chloroflexi bacterium]|nr:DUF711 family protein [Chloroflexota bacterium]